MNISQHGLDFIANFEGGESSDGLFHAYWDPWGKVWTIGYGETQNVHPGMTWTKAQAEAELKAKIESSYEPAINALGVPLTQNQYDALCSFVWNLGPGSMQWDVGRDLRARNYAAAANAMLEYTHAGGVVLPGLVRRRQAEHDLFLAPDPHPSDPNHYLEYPTEELTYQGHHFNEQRLAEHIDGWLHHPRFHHRALQEALPVAEVVKKRIWVVSVLAPPDYKKYRDHPDWGEYSRGRRYQWWTVRIQHMKQALGIH